MNNPTTADYLESLQSDLDRITEALNLEEGTNFTDIAQMSEDGDISGGDEILHYKGHVASENLLPAIGQPSGTRIGNVCTPYSSVYSNMLKASSETTLIGYSSYKDYFLILDAPNSSYYGGIIFATDYPEQISVFFGRISYQTNYHTVGVAIKYDANKPVYYRTHKNTTNSNYEVLYDKESGSTGYINTDVLEWTLIDENTNFFKGVNSDNYALEKNHATNKYYEPHITNNIPNLKFKKTTFNHLILSTIVGTPIEADTFTNPENTYYYNDGMILTQCPDGNYQHTAFVTADTTVKKNDVYTVGDDYDIYRANELPQWEVWSKKLDLTTITGYDGTTTQTLKNDNGTIKWVSDE